MTQEFTQFLNIYSVMGILAITGYIIPFVSKKGILFGTHLDEDDFEKIQITQLKYFFKITYWITTISYLIITGFLYYRHPQTLISGASVVIQLFLIYTILVIFNRKAAKIKATKKTEKKEEYVAVDTSFRSEKHTLSIFWFLPASTIVTINFILVYLNENTALLSALKRSVPSFIILLISIIIYLIIKTSRQQISVNYPKTTIIQDHLFRYRWSIFIIVFSILLTSFHLLLSFQRMHMINISSDAIFYINYLLMISLLISPLILALKTGQSGSLIRAKIKEQGNDFNSYDDDKYWKSGFLYINPNDPAIFIEKRMGIGWTINFGNPMGVFFVILVAIIIIMANF